VLANARACLPLAETLPAGTLAESIHNALQSTQTMHGSMSCGIQPEPLQEHAFPPCAVNGHGSFLAGVPQDEALHWYAGSTFESDVLRATDDLLSLHSNRQKLKRLLPRAAAALAPQLDNNASWQWVGTRLISHDRLPLVGALQSGPSPTLWINAAMGARGLSFSALCAELLVAQMLNEPLPMERSLCKALNSQRLQRPPAMTTAAPLPDAGC
jgi:tRNA 5-methylaminomethyl-2-thiouridine biosynthesis bifunctional protein